MIKMTGQRISVFIGLASITALLVAGLWLVMLNLPPSGSTGDTVEIDIESGMSAADIAALLEKEGIIRSARFFRAYAKITGRDSHFKAGLRPIDTSLTTSTITDLLTELPPAPPDIRVTVIEGLTIRETASTLASQAGIDSTRFVTLAKDSTVAHKLGVDKKTLEGYLYPDTYFVRPRTEPLDMIRRMTGRFHEVFTDSLKARAEELGMSTGDIVTLASIIECEVTIDSELPLVSSVFHRRLKRNRPLEANPTIQYALGTKRRILYEDLTIDSPYNTYIHTGLPPGPISSPGLKSILAALYPADTDYLYFVADGDGGHVFSRTITEHERAVREYRKKMRSIRAQRSK